LELPGGTKAVQIPVGYSKVDFRNGTVTEAWSYYLVEFRVATGIDQNLTSSILITLGNNTRFYEGLSGLLIRGGEETVGPV
jgi:hypothetical protein